MSTITPNVNHTANTYGSTYAKQPSEKTQEKNTTLATDNVDKFDSDSVNVNRNYNTEAKRAELSVNSYNKLSAFQMKNAAIADYVKGNITQQAGNDFWSQISSMTYTPKSFALDAFNTAEKTSEKYGDYWGVDATAERIFTFAKTLAGDNDELFDTMKNAFLKGFNLASKAAGGNLPDISGQTKAKVLELFDGWEAEIKVRKNPEPAQPAATK